VKKQRKNITGMSQALSDTTYFYPSNKLSGNRSIKTKLILGIIAIAVLISSYWLLSKTGALDIMMDREMLQVRISQLGLWGPLIIISLIAAAIVFSPLPSAPIALAAGAVFGHTYGTVYVLIGSMIGAMVAFSIARVLGYDVVHKWIDKRFSVKFPGGQNALMGMVFATRLIPFISFDSISYLAGLTSLSFWRFAAATFAGIIPASFLLAHFGSELVMAKAGQGMIAAFFLGGVTLIPLAFAVMMKRRQKRDG
jgi:uncharacterized membrane protein YdjX (TVP38/TMEM64 family)